jgi:hypothetical protein
MDTTDVAPSPTRHIPLDPEHAGIRIALPLIGIIAFPVLLGLFSTLINALIPTGGNECLIGLAALVGTLGLMAALDPILKRVWPSGRTLTLTEDSLTLSDTRRGKESQTQIVLQTRINWLAWRFTVKRGSARVSRGWIMLGCQLVQDDAQMTLYTFVPAKEADHPRYKDFTQLILPTVLEKGNLPLREVAQHRRLLKAERDRWEGGSEVGREDFAALIEGLQRHHVILSEA